MTGNVLWGAVALDHIGIAVSDLAAAELLYTVALGGRIVSREQRDDERVRLTFVDAAGALFELLTPTAEDGPLARFLRSRGEGLHHLAFEVPDLDAALRVVAFLHPSAARGVLVELVQRPA